MIGFTANDFVIIEKWYKPSASTPNNYNLRQRTIHMILGEGWGDAKANFNYFSLSLHAKK